VPKPGAILLLVSNPAYFYADAAFAVGFSARVTLNAFGKCDSWEMRKMSFRSPAIGLRYSPEESPSSGSVNVPTAGNVALFSCPRLVFEKGKL